MKFVKTVVVTAFFIIIGLAALGSMVEKDATAKKAITTVTFSAEEKATQIAALDEEVREIPASDYAKNLRLYQKLLALDPSSDHYRKKVAHYQRKQSEGQEMKRYPERYVKVTDFSWRKEAFASIMEVDLTITNALPVQVKDIEVLCRHFAPSGTVIDENRRTIFEVIGAGKTRTFRNFNMGFIHTQATQSGCAVVDVVTVG